MTDEPQARPDKGEVELLLAAAARLYGCGPIPDGQPLPEDTESARLWHGEVLADISYPANDDRDVFASVARGHGLDTAAGLRDLVRLSAAETAVGVLRYVLGHDDPYTGRPVMPGVVIDEILTRQWWLTATIEVPPPETAR